MQRPDAAPQLLFDSQLRDGGIDHPASGADDLDPAADSELLTDRGLGASAKNHSARNHLSQEVVRAQERYHSQAAQRAFTILPFSIKVDI
jgi:hypothetical protein